MSSTTPPSGPDGHATVLDYSDGKLEQGLPMVASVDPEALAAESALLSELQTKPLPRRFGGYLKLSGPGWLQSAMTLGGGSAASSLLAGYVAGYDLLWVQPIAMACGIIMLSAIGYQVLTTGERPFSAIRTHIHPSVAWAWALCTWISSIIWAFPQFSLAESAIADMAGIVGIPTQKMITSALILFVGAGVAWKYGKGGRVMHLYELAIKLMVGGIIICFLFVVIALIAKGNVSFTDIAGGYSFRFPTDPKAMDVLIAGFATAVGINMTFLFPYTLIARQWGKEHVGLMRFDLGFSMMIPYVLATSFIIIASAFAFQGVSVDGRPQAMDLARALEPVAGTFISHFIFDLGILGMTLSSVCLLMLVSGFVGIEVFKFPAGSRGHRLMMFSPGVGFLGPIAWADYGFYMAVPTSIACFLMLPIAYIAIMILHNRPAYMKEHMPRGLRRWGWNSAMFMATSIVSVTAGYQIYRKIIALLGS